ncbi:MAG: hypothetical protein Q8N83_17085 [Ignavibacteria bacterium]|nr:hypothetical protein [Ignavibacteria bacterium]
MKASIISIFFLQFFVSSCVSSNCTRNLQNVENGNQHDNSVKELAVEKYGESFDLLENETSEFYLVISRNKSATETSVKFFVYDQGKHAVILEDFIPLGSVKWTGSYHINVQKFPGTVRIDNPNSGNAGYLFNVKTKQEIKIN